MADRKIEELPVPLHRDDIEQKSELLAQLTVKRIELEDAKKVSASVFKDQLDGVNDEIAKLADELKHKRVIAWVEVSDQVNHDTREVLTYRNDTGQIIRRRAARKDELQLDLPS